MTSWTRASLLLGRFLSGTVSQVLQEGPWLQVLVCAGAVDTEGPGLNYISLAMVSVATITSFFLPTVQSAVYFHRQVTNQ